MIKQNIYDNFDDAYQDIVNYIAEHGTWSGKNVRTKYADGTPALYKSVHGLQIVFQNKDVEIKDGRVYFTPLLCTTRQTTWKSALRELYWIWVLQSNNVEELRKLGCKYWNEWELEDGTIGPAYGNQIAKPIYGYKNQLDYVIGELKKNPESRRIVTEIWFPEDLYKMALTPCVHLTQWSVVDGQLVLEVRQRSADVALGVISNHYQYQVLQHLVAHTVGLKCGPMIWSFHNAHIYDRHYDKLLEQVNEREAYIVPKMSFPVFDDIYKLKPDDIRLEETYEHGSQIKYEIAI